MPFPKKDLATRFWSHVEKSDGCWLWTGAVDRDGYGAITVYDANKRRHVKAHRMSYELTYGVSLGSMFACHHCDNPSCVRPDHIFPGTAADNYRDHTRKGRHHPGTKLTRQQVIEIRARFIPYVVTAAMLAKEYGVTKYAIRKIIYRCVWKHI